MNPVKWRGAFAPLSLMLLSLTLVVGCKSNPHKAEVLNTKTEMESTVASNERVGIDAEGDMVFQKKAMIAEELRKLQNDTYQLEDKVYGTRKYNTRGLYGVYSTCLKKLSNEEKADLPKLEKMDRWSDKDEEVKVGIDADQNKLASITEEKLKDRLGKFQEYRRVLQEREDEYTENITTCETRVKAKK